MFRMFRPSHIAAPLVLLSTLALPGCSSMNELAALRLVTFEFTGVSDVRLVGIPIGPGADYSKLGVADVARLAAAMISKQAPIDLIAHVGATNPRENKVRARMVEMGWSLFVEDRKALDGTLGNAVTITPGQTTDIPLMAHFDAVQLGVSGARDLFDVAVAIAGQGVVKKDLRLELVPSIETSVGPIRYPAPIQVTRVAGPR